MRWFFLFLAVAFIGTLAAVIGARASMEGGAFTLGLACGAAASLPASLLAIYLERRVEPAQPAKPKEPQAYPPVVIINGPAPSRQQALPDFPPPIQAGAQASGPRYRVIGDE
jgi:hypothetical protein